MDKLEEIKTKIEISNPITPFAKNEVEYLLEVIENQKEEIHQLETELMMLR